MSLTDDRYQEIERLVRNGLYDPSKEERDEAFEALSRFALRKSVSDAVISNSLSIFFIGVSVILLATFPLFPIYKEASIVTILCCIAAAPISRYILRRKFLKPAYFSEWLESEQARRSEIFIASVGDQK